MKINRNLLIITVVIGILSVIWNSLTCGWLFRWVYMLEPIGVWKPFNEFPVFLAIIWAFILAFILAWVYSLIYKSLPGKGLIKGLWFGLIVWLLKSLPLVVFLFMLTVIAKGVLFYWLIDFFLISLWQGVVIAAFYKEE